MQFAPVKFFALWELWQTGIGGHPPSAATAVTRIDFTHWLAQLLRLRDSGQMTRTQHFDEANNAATQQERNYLETGIKLRSHNADAKFSVPSAMANSPASASCAYN